MKKNICLSYVMLTFLVIGLACQAGRGGEEENAQSTPAIGLKHLGEARFSIAVLNRTNTPISLGQISSSLGYDQFIFKIRTSEGLIVARAKFEGFTVDPLIPAVIPSGSYREFSVDLGKGTWELVKVEKDTPQAIREVYQAKKAIWKATDSEHVMANFWKSAQVVYQPDGCDDRELRLKKGIYSKEIQGMWIKLDSQRESADK